MSHSSIQESGASKCEPSFGKLHARMAHFGPSGNGVPNVSDGDSARVLFWLNLSGAYNGNERIEEAKADCQFIVTAVNAYAANQARIAELEGALKALADIPLEEFGKQNNPDQPLMGWNQHSIYVRDVLTARKALGGAK